MIGTKAERVARGKALVFSFLLAALAAAACLMLAAKPAHAASPFVVNNTGDAVDAAPGDGACDTTPPGA